MNGNRQQSNGRLNKPQPQQPAKQPGIFVPRQYLPDTSERSLQINIDSEDDAKSVIQNLQAVKNAYDKAGVTSVEFCIAESVAQAVEHTLMGAICWCRTYIKHIAPQPGNVLFPLPAYQDLSQPPAQTQTAPISPEGTPPVNTTPQAHVKPQRPVRADSARQ